MVVTSTHTFTDPESTDEVDWNLAEPLARLGCERGTLSRLLNGKVGLSANMALALKRIDRETADHWMRMQTRSNWRKFAESRPTEKGWRMLGQRDLLLLRRRGCDSRPDAERSRQARTKVANRTNPDGDSVHRAATMLHDLATVTLNQVVRQDIPTVLSPWVTKATTLRAKMFRLLKIDPESGVAINRAG